MQTKKIAKVGNLFCYKTQDELCCIPCLLQGNHIGVIFFANQYGYLWEGIGPYIVYIIR